MEELNIINNKRQFRFEAILPNGEFATLEYRWLKGNIVLMRTVVPVAYRGKGIGGRLVRYVLEYVRTQHFKAIIYCPFILEYLKTHKEYNDVIAEAN